MIKIKFLIDLFFLRLVFIPLQRKLLTIVLNKPTGEAIMYLPTGVNNL